MRLVLGRSTPAIRAIFLSLPLLVLLIRANDAHDAAAPDDLALVANSLDRCSHLHRCSYPQSTQQPPRAQKINSLCRLGDLASIVITASPRSVRARRRPARAPRAPDRRP